MARYPSCRVDQTVGHLRNALYDGTDNDVVACRAGMKTASGIKLHDGVATNDIFCLFDLNRRSRARDASSNEDFGRALDGREHDAMGFSCGEPCRLAIKIGETIVDGDHLTRDADGLFVKATSGKPVDAIADEAPSAAPTTVVEYIKATALWNTGRLEP